MSSQLARFLDSRAMTWQEQVAEGAKDPLCVLLGDALLLDKWFKAQAISDLPDQVERIIALQKHKDFSFTNPNRLKALIDVFSTSNKVHFHQKDGKGYKVVIDVIVKVLSPRKHKGPCRNFQTRNRKEAN